MRERGVVEGSKRLSIKICVAMPTLVWIRRPESSTGAAAGRDSARKAVPDPVGSAAVPNSAVSSGVALPANSSNRINRFAGTRPDEGMEKKHKKSRANAAKRAKKKSKTSTKRDLPTGVRKLRPGKFKSEIWWRGKDHYIGAFDTPEQASGAYMSIKKKIGDANLSALGVDEVQAMFDAAKKKAAESVGGFTFETRGLPQGVHKIPSGKFQSRIKWGCKQRHIGTFDTLEQASAAFISVKKVLDDAKVSACGANEVDAIFDEAKKNALESFGGFIPEERDLPTGVLKRPSGKYQSRISGVARPVILAVLTLPSKPLPRASW